MSRPPCDGAPPTPVPPSSASVHARDGTLVGGNGALQVAEPVALVAQVEERPGEVVEELERTGRRRRLEAGHGALERRVRASGRRIPSGNWSTR